jgi:hypothetical protein
MRGEGRGEGGEVVPGSKSVSASQGSTRRKDRSGELGVSCCVESVRLCHSDSKVR